MKQLTKILVLAIVLISIGFIGCKKQIREQDDNINTLQSKYNFDNFNNKIEYENFKQKVSLIFADALEQYILKKDFTNFIIDKVRRDSTGFIPLDYIIKKYPKFIETINMYLHKNKEFSDYNYGRLILEIKKSYNDYVPVINIPNYKNCNESIIPLVSPGIEIRNNKIQGKDKSIWAFKKTINTSERVKINEKQVFESNCPLFVISYNSDEDIRLAKEDKMRDIEDNGSTKVIRTKNSALYKLKICQLQINDRYDKTRRSEVNIKMLAVSKNGTITYIFNGKHKLVYDYPKDKINIMIDINTFLFTSYAYWTGSEEIFFNLYERDWYASKKLILKAYSQYLGKTLYIYGKMNHSWNWYLYDPNKYNYGYSFVKGYNKLSSSKCIVNFKKY